MKETISRPLVITRVREQGRDIRSFDMQFETDSGRAASAASHLAFLPGQVAALRAGDAAERSF